MARLDKTFPTGDCTTCIISPKLVAVHEGLQHRSNDDGRRHVAGGRGRRRSGPRSVADPRNIKDEKCTGCGDCWERLPGAQHGRHAAAIRPPSEPLAEEGRRQAPTPFSRTMRASKAHHAGAAGVNKAYGYLPGAGAGAPGQPVGNADCRDPAGGQLLRPFSSWSRLGRHVVEVCEGTSCHARGWRALRGPAPERAGHRTRPRPIHHGRFTLRTVRCLGLCALSPAMKIDGHSFGRVNVDREEEILEQFA